MTVYVDELQRYPTKIRCFVAGSCHLMADTVDELHELAQRIGLRREWFQPLSSPHYDLTASKREKALAAGAVFVPAREQARKRVAMRGERYAATRDGACRRMHPTVAISCELPIGHDGSCHMTRRFWGPA